jgi:hypothetical protein
MDKIVAKQIWGELTREGKPPINVKLNITVREVQPDQSLVPVERILQELRLSPMSGMAVEDGSDYILHFTFEGKQEQQKSRVDRDNLFAR